MTQTDIIKKIQTSERYNIFFRGRRLEESKEIKE